MATLIDSWVDLYADNFFSLNNGLNIMAGQSFANVNSIVLNSCDFKLSKSGSPTGNATVYIYAHTGTYGTSSIPTGSALATSNTLDVSTLTGSFVLKTFTFSGADKITLTANTKYCVIIAYSGGNSSNQLWLQASSSGSALGNSIYYNTSWHAYTRDVLFHVYGDSAVTTNIKNINGLAIASVSNVNGLALASMKNFNGLT